MAFLEKYKWLIAILVDYDACRRIAYENVEDLLKERIDYAELRFSPWFMATGNDLDPQGVVEAVVDGVEAGVRDFGVPVQLIGIISRTYGPEAGSRELDSIQAFKDHFIAVDLAGDEAGYPAPLFTDHFKRVRDAGLHVTVHAGESDGPGSIRNAIELLGAERIGHAVRAFEDPSVIDLMRDRHIGIEANLTSTVQTSTEDSFAATLEAISRGRPAGDHQHGHPAFLQSRSSMSTRSLHQLRFIPQADRSVQANAPRDCLLHPLDKQSLWQRKKSRWGIRR